MLQPCEGGIRMRRPCLSTLLTQRRTDWKVCNGDILKQLASVTVISFLFVYGMRRHNMCGFAFNLFLLPGQILFMCGRYLHLN